MKTDRARTAALPSPERIPWVLATGGAGFIGSHVAAVLLDAGFGVMILDSFANAHPSVIARLEALGPGRVRLAQGDVRDGRLLDSALRAVPVSAVIHLAGLKAVGESVAEPVRYYDVNLGGAVALLAAMERHGVRRLVFSSSATVYAAPGLLTPETAPLGALNPYGRTKLHTEHLLTDAVAADPALAAISLRYFNPVGAHPSGLLGEAPRGVPGNLFPLIAQAAAGQRPTLTVFGGDWPTPDGTGVRDYIHVMDLARGHLAAVRALIERGDFVGRHTPINLGTGRGASVLEAVAAFEAASGRRVPLAFAPRRAGDAAACTADPTLARQLLRWSAEHDLARMCSDHWGFHSAASRAAA
jgi:UDP-glucose 4-epimerase